jgi:hypothetical protein
MQNPMKFAGILIGMAAILLVVAVELSIHWYADTHTNRAAKIIQNIYLYRDPDNKKPYGAGLIDLVIPSLILGVILGISMARSSPRYVMPCVVIGAVILSGLLVMYKAFADGSTIDGLLDIASFEASSLFSAFVKIVSLTGVFCYGARISFGYFFQRRAGSITRFQN